VIPVHFAGQVADMDAIMTVAGKHKLLVIEDAAHAQGASHKNRPAGSLGHVASFSFQSSKNLTSGEGGIITTSDDELAAMCRSMHNCGRVPEGVWYEHHVISGNYRLGELQGALLNAQLERLEEQTKTRDANGRHLAERLANLPGLHPQRRPDFCTRHSCHLFMLRIDAAKFGAPRAAVIEALRAEGIPCAAGYGFSLHEQPMFRNRAFGPYLPGTVEKLDYSRVRCPNSDLLCREQALWLEQALFLGHRADIDDIARAFEKVRENRAALAEWSRRERTY
jgi:dTDP-4-amino-4,6-dideoxygalactose transaminase